MTEPVLVARDALAGLNVGVSVSDSADLSRLGLRPSHCALAVVEIARAILLAGGRIVYGGDLRAGGFAALLVNEVRSYADGRRALTICLPRTAHEAMTDEELALADRRLGTAGRLIVMAPDGRAVPPGQRSPAAGPLDAPAALTDLRRHLTAVTAARIIVGGALTGHQGDAPGVVEEALMSVQARQPLYAAGGFGGAALAIARALGRDPAAWAPPGVPQGADAPPAAAALNALETAFHDLGGADDGLGVAQRHQLAATHRPGEIAALAALGLARAPLAGANT